MNNPANPAPSFHDQLISWAADLQSMINANRTDLTKQKVTIDPRGKRYVRIVTSDLDDPTRGRSVYCFVRRSDGAILKAASWKAPEPKQHVRGNIYNGLDGCDEYGVAYLRR